MQLDNFYISIIQITLFDAIAIGATSGLLLSTFFGIKLKRQNSSTLSWLLGGAAGVVLGTLFGYFVMNTIGYVTAATGSPIQGLEGADLVEWTETIAAFFAPYQMHAAGFAVMGALLGIGWGRGIGSRPDDTSLFGNLIATLGACSIVCGLLLTIIPSFLTFSYQNAFFYLMLFNELIFLSYGLMALVNQGRVDSSHEEDASGQDELVV